MRNKLLVIILISLFSFAYSASGQKLINSPYSRFNIGSLERIGSFRSLGMGGTGTAMRDNSSIYFTNPASYSSIDTNSFVFDFGIDYGSNFISDGTTNFSSEDMDFHHLIMGFPLAKGFGVALGAVPVSSGYYDIQQSVSSTDPSYNPNIGEYKIDHTGNGGITKFFIGTGIMIGKHLSAGANFAIWSGQLTRANQFVFSDETDYYSVFHNTSQEKLELLGINLDYGLEYTTTFKNNYFLNIGASLRSGNNYHTKYNQLSLKYTAFSVSDTISYTPVSSTKTFIPGTLSLGISFGKKYKFTTGIDYVATRWSNATIPGSGSGVIGNTQEIMVGAEFIPDKFSNYSFVNRIEYRIGGHIGDDYLIVDGNQTREYGASMGLGIPLRRSASKVNIYFDYTNKSGSSSTSLHYENFFTMGISLNLYDFWFLKRKYE